MSIPNIRGSKGIIKVFGLIHLLPKGLLGEYLLVWKVQTFVQSGPRIFQSLVAQNKNIPHKNVFSY